MERKADSWPPRCSSCCWNTRHVSCLAEELIFSHVNSFLPVAKLALPSVSLHTKASILSYLAPVGAAMASKRITPHSQAVIRVNTKLQKERVLSFKITTHIPTCLALLTSSFPFSLLHIYSPFLLPTQHISNAKALERYQQNKPSSCMSQTIIPNPLFVTPKRS